MWIEIEHDLSFSYTDFIRESRMELRTQPRTTVDQTLHTFAIAVGPPTRPGRYVDWNGNTVHHFGITSYHDQIEVIVRSIADTHPTRTELPTAMAAAPTGEEVGPLGDFLTFGDGVVRSPRLEAALSELTVPADAPVVEQIRGTGAFVHQNFRYEPGVTNYKSTTENLFDSQAGVCQDFAHLQLGLLRLRGVPCRYVSGYIVVSQGQAAQSHGWIEAYCPGEGWLGFDPTHDRMPTEEYVLVARGRWYGDVPPNRGIFRGKAQEALEPTVKVRQVEAPKDVIGLYEEVRALEIPVFRELPKPRDKDVSDGAVEEQQQQQQQQQ